MKREASRARRIFVDCHVFDGGFQGTRTYIKGLYSELIGEKSLHFFLAASNIEKLREEFGEADNISYLKYPAGGKIKRLLFDLPVMLRKNKIDFAHFQYRVPPVKVCRYIVTTHDVLFEDFPEYFPKSDRFVSLLTYKLSARMADLVLTVSSFAKEEIRRYLGVPDALITPNGVDSVFFEKYDKAEVQELVKERFNLDNYLLYTSRLEPRKNQHLLLRHFIESGLYKTNQLVFVGHETFPNPELHRIFEEQPAEIKNQVVFIQHLPFPDMLLLLRASRAFIYPSMAEGFGIPPLEAAAAEIPVLCSRETAMADFTFFGERLFRPDDASEFVSKLKTITTEQPDPEYLTKISTEVARRYNWKNASQIFLEAISKFDK